MSSLLKQRLSANFLNYRWLIHLGFWVLYITLMYFSTGIGGKKYPDFFVKGAFVITVTAVFVQSNIFLLFVVPLLQKKKKYLFWLFFLLLICAGYLFYTILMSSLAGAVPGMEKYKNFTFHELLQSSFMFYFILNAIFIAFYYFIDIYDRQAELRKLESVKTEKIALESSFLKSQINPHFLFNTLNNIYALSMKKSDQTAVIIDRLESLLHYMLYECKADFVPLDNEFIFTSSYIALERLRHKEDQCQVTTQIKGNTNGHKIAPLLLINFLENAFKHGTKTSFGKSWINMDIEITKKELRFKLANSKPQRPANHVVSEYTGGIGLKNVKRRLEILYPRKHQLQIHNEADRFEIDLTINL